MDDHTINEYGWVIVIILVISTLLSVVPGITKAFNTRSEIQVREQFEDKEEVVTTYKSETILNSNGDLISVGKTASLNVVVRVSKDRSIILITKNGTYEDRNSNDGLMIDNLSSYLKGKGVDIKKIKSVTIEEGVTNIGVNAFDGFTNLVGIDIPSSVKNVSSGAFSNCSKLQNIAYEGLATDWNDVSLAGDWNLNSKLSFIN